MNEYVMVCTRKGVVLPRVSRVRGGATHQQLTSCPAMTDCTGWSQRAMGSSHPYARTKAHYRIKFIHYLCRNTNCQHLVLILIFLLII